MRSTVDIENVRQIIREATVVEIGQLMYFFRNDIRPPKLEFYINWLNRRGEVQYDVESGLVRWYHNAMIEKEYVRKFLKAFWVIAYLGSENVDSIHAMQSPFCYEIILNTEDGSLVYDIAVCNNTRDGFAAAREMQRLQIKGVPDDCVHLVLVPDKTIGDTMEPYGFDSYVTLKRYKDRRLSQAVMQPEFSTWEG